MFAQLSVVMHMSQVCLLVLGLSTAIAVSFHDVTWECGLGQTQPTLKFGGPHIADLNMDGIYDVILSHHNQQAPSIYFGNPNHTFTRVPFKPPVWDIHGIAVAPHSPILKQRILALSVGGGMGNSLKIPLFYIFGPDGKFEDISNKLGLGGVHTRGRNVQFMDLTMTGAGGPDAVVVSFRGNGKEADKQFSYQNRGYDFLERGVGEFEKEVRGRVEVTDVNGDGRMELISVRRLRFYSLRKPFEFIDVTNKVFPDHWMMAKLTVTAVVELDFDNDGDFDLYVARARRSITTAYRDTGDAEMRDMLLENRDGVYVDVSDGSGVVSEMNSVGVTAGDFDNDGYIDVFVSIWKARDVLLLNRGDGTFERIRGIVKKKEGIVGNNAVAVDYDGDGKVDLLVGQGDVNKRRGMYTMLKNTSTVGRWLLVRVGNDPSRTATMMHAVVTVWGRGRMWKRRVGSAGAQGGGGSFLDTVHIGVGDLEKVGGVRVWWTSGESVIMQNVDTNQKLTFGLM